MKQRQMTKAESLADQDFTAWARDDYLRNGMAQFCDFSEYRQALAATMQGQGLQLSFICHRAIGQPLRLWLDRVTRRIRVMLTN